MLLFLFLDDIRELSQSYMDQEIFFYWNQDFRINHDELVCLLKELGDLLPDPLSDRIDLRAYADKLIQFADLEFAIADHQPIGIVALYANDLINFVSHIPLVSLKKEYHQQGIGKRMMLNAILFAKNKGMKRLWLHVHQENTHAINFYKSLGFFQTETNGQKLKFEIFLESNEQELK